MENQTISFIDFLPQYRHLNTLYSAIIEKSDITYSEQCFITEFWQNNKDVRIFDEMVINLLLTNDKETQSSLMQSLSLEIHKNIELYTVNKGFFDSIDTYSVCVNESKVFDTETEHQEKKANALWQELIIVRGDLEGESWKGNERETIRLTKEEERINQIYKEEHNKVELLYKRQQSQREKVFKYIKNQFPEISKLSQSFLAILESYSQVKTNNAKQVQIPQSDIPYFDMNIISAIHKECNDIQFKNISELDLYSNLNNRPYNALLEIKAGEKLRVCYLIHKLYESLKTENKSDWRNYILQLLGIKESLYTSKYKECTSEWASPESRDFVKRIDRIFK